jgi:hypothetical protein
MRAGFERLAHGLCALFAAVALAACAGAPSGGSGRAAAPVVHGAAGASAAVAPDDPSTDWHRLMPMPFGTLLKASPVALHEVLLFRDDAHPGAVVDGRECYSPNASAPLFFGVGPDRYLLCFVDDRLERIDVTVRIAAVDAAARLAHACRIWLQETAAQPATGGLCDGRRDGVVLRARLVSAPEDSPRDDGMDTLSLTLSAVPPP